MIAKITKNDIVVGAKIKLAFDDDALKTAEILTIIAIDIGKNLRKLCKHIPYNCDDKQIIVYHTCTYDEYDQVVQSNIHYLIEAPIITCSKSRFALIDNND